MVFHIKFMLALFYNKKCCNGFSISWWKLIAQDNEVRNLPATNSRMDDPQIVIWKARVGSWKVKWQAVFCESFCNLANLQLTCETFFLGDFKHDSYTIYSYYIYPHYPQD